jgi:sensor histidine kinase regulating citrate/malate metabolism
MYYAISRNRGTDGGERKYFFLLKIMYPVITAILIFLISRLIMANGGKSYGIEWGIMLLMGANIISFRFIEKAVDMIREKESYQRALEANALKVERYEELEREQKAWMQREHDLSKHLTAIGGLAKEKKDQEILDILDGIRVQIGEIQDACYVKNGVVNALLKVKLSEARREGISVDFYAEPNISLDDYDIGDMIAIIGNQFENAIEASGRCEGEKKIWARYYCLDNRQIVLEMENSFMDVPMKAGVMNSTSKADNERHGMGMRIIRETVDRNEGLFYTDKVNGFFRSVIVLPQKEKVIC